MYTLYHYPYSQHARRVHSLMIEGELDFQLHHVAMDRGDYLTAQYIAINPNHQIPSLVDGDVGVQIHESNAALRYLCVKHALRSWYPVDLKPRALVEQWLDWNQCRLSPSTVGIVLNSVFLGEHGDSDAIAKGYEAMKELSEILDQGLAQSDYLAGNSPTIADLSVASNIFQLGMADAIPKQDNIQAWYSRICKLKGFQQSLPAQ